MNSLARPAGDQYHNELVEQCGKVRRFLPNLLAIVEIKAAPAGIATMNALTYLAEVARGGINTRRAVQHWDDMLRIVGSLKLGTVRASKLIRSLLKSERLSGLTQAIMEVGCCLRTEIHAKQRWAKTQALRHSRVCRIATGLLVASLHYAG